MVLSTRTGVFEITGITVTEKERVSASNDNFKHHEAAGRPGKAASDSRLLPGLIYKWLCTCP